MEDPLDVSTRAPSAPSLNPNSPHADSPTQTRARQFKFQRRASLVQTSHSKTYADQMRHHGSTTNTMLNPDLNSWSRLRGVSMLGQLIEANFPHLASDGNFNGQGSKKSDSIDNTQRSDSANALFSINTDYFKKSLNDVLLQHRASHRAQLNSFTLSFKSFPEEQQYRRFFIDQTLADWRMLTVAGIILIAIFEIVIAATYSLPRSATTFTTEAIFIGCFGILPLSVVTGLGFFLPKDLMTHSIHGLSMAYISFVGPVLICGRYFIGQNSFDSVASASFYLAVMFLGIFFLKLRFIYTVLTFTIATPIWLGINISSLLSKDPDDSGYRNMALTWSSISVVIATLAIIGASYINERSRRFEYLSNLQFFKTNNKLLSQLKGLQYSYENRLLNFDSPIEKAIMGVKAVLCSPISSEQIRILTLVLSCLTSTNIASPDLYQQVKVGNVMVDDEQEVKFSFVTYKFGNPLTTCIKYIFFF